MQYISQYVCKKNKERRDKGDGKIRLGNEDKGIEQQTSHTQSRYEVVVKWVGSKVGKVPYSSKATFPRYLPQTSHTWIGLDRKHPNLGTWGFNILSFFDLTDVNE